MIVKRPWIPVTLSTLSTSLRAVSLVFIGFVVGMTGGPAGAAATCLAQAKVLPKP